MSRRRRPVARRAAPRLAGQAPESGAACWTPVSGTRFCARARCPEATARWRRSSSPSWLSASPRVRTGSTSRRHRCGYGIHLKASGAVRGVSLPNAQRTMARGSHDPLAAEPRDHAHRRTPSWFAYAAGTAPGDCRRPWRLQSWQRYSEAAAPASRSSRGAPRPCTPGCGRLRQGTEFAESPIPRNPTPSRVG
jgi:hypothetical protein